MQEKDRENKNRNNSNYRYGFVRNNLTRTCASHVWLSMWGLINGASYHYQWLLNNDGCHIFFKREKKSEAKRGFKYSMSLSTR